MSASKKRRCFEGGAQYLRGSDTFQRVYRRAAVIGEQVPCADCGKLVKLRYGPMGIAHAMIPPHNRSKA